MAAGVEKGSSGIPEKNVPEKDVSLTGACAFNDPALALALLLSSLSSILLASAPPPPRFSL